MVAGFRGEDTDTDAVEGETVTGSVTNYVRARGICFSEDSVVEDGVGIDADPQLAGAEIGEDCGHAADVVGVGVGDGDGVEAADAAGPEDRRNDVVANVEIGGVGVGVGGVGTVGTNNAACIDEEGFAVRRDDEEAVSLAYVDGGDFEGGGSVSDGMRESCYGACEKQGCGSGGESEALHSNEE